MVDRSFLTWNEREQPIGQVELKPGETVTHRFTVAGGAPVGLGLNHDPDQKIWLRCYVNGVEVRMAGKASTVNYLLNRMIRPPDTGISMYLDELQTGETP